MPQVDLLIAALSAHAHVAGLAPLRFLFVLGDIAGFFANLYADLLAFGVAWTTFFFAWSALLFGSSGTTGNERTRQHAMNALYAALAGLALVILSGTIAGIINTAAAGQ